ncbi:MAG: hypothetical protein J7L41_01415 [Synergistetes bacterium]|nr:hypothetical protein [Synergistota bacterium]
MSELHRSSAVSRNPAAKDGEILNLIFAQLGWNFKHPASYIESVPEAALGMQIFTTLEELTSRFIFVEP